MENGLGVAGGVKVGGDRISELKAEEGVVGVHGSKDSEGDEFFEAVVESVIDEGYESSHGLKSGSVDDAICSIANDNDSGSFFCDVEGTSGVQDEEEMGESTLDGPVESCDGERESAEKKEVPAPPPSVDNGEGSLAHLNDNGMIATIDGRVVDQEASLSGISCDIETVESPSKAPGYDPLAAEGAEPIVRDEVAVEKSIILDTLENRDVEKADGNDSGTSASKDVEDTVVNGNIHHARETVREYTKSSEDQPGKIENNGSTELDRNLADTNLEIQATSGESEIGNVQSNVEDSQTTSFPEHQDGDSRVEKRSSDTSNLVDNVDEASEREPPPTPLATSSVGHDLKDKTVASDSLANTSHQLNSSGTVGDRQASAKGYASHEEKDEGGKRGKEKQNDQATKETAKPAQFAVSSSEKAANPAVPSTRPAGLGPAAPLLPPAPRAAHQPRANGQLSQVQSNVAEESNNGVVEEVDEVREKLQMIRVKFLRLAHRLGQTPHNVVVAQVLYRLGLAEQLRSSNGGRVGAFSFDRASAMAEQLEATGQEPLDFSCTIMVLGKTGVGKSATINSIFDEVKFCTDAFQMGTKKVQDVVGTVQGIKVRVIDTPGLLSSCSDQLQNLKILHSVKSFIKKSPPDIVLYLDRLDMPSRDFADMPLLRTITEVFEPSIWFNAIVVLTHAASAPPEGPNGTASTYDMFVTQRSHAVQQSIRQAAGDMRLMNPVSLVENHSACRTNRAGQRVLPNGQVWKPHLLLLSFASKILAEANTLLKLQDSPPGKSFAARSRAPPLPFLLSSLLQSKPQLKLPEEQFGDDDAMDDDLGESSESDDESEYDELPPFRPLTRAQLATLSKAQKKAYFDELEYREKLLMKKQMKDEKRRRKMMKKMADTAKDMLAEYAENVEEESSGASSVPVPMPDLTLPASFDSDNPTHRYRYLDTSNQWLVRPVLDNHGWDHDVGYEGVNLERMFVVKDKIPLSFSGQISKDKKEANLQMEVASSIKHGEGKSTSLGFDMQNVGKDMAYTLRSETRFSNYRHNKATAGLSATLLGDALTAGVKLEDKLIVNKRFKVVTSGGAMACRGDVAYGGSLEATFRDKDYPLGRFLSTMGLSIMDWHGELAIGCNIQSQIPVGRFTNLIARANLNNRGSGQVSLRMNSSEQLQLALIGLLPLLRKLVGEYQEHSFGH